MKQLILTALKPRNPFVAPSLRRVAGPHRASVGARRQAERHETRKLLRAEDGARRHEKHL